MRNRIKIICAPYNDNHISYYFQNEAGAWVVCSSSSELSRNFYTHTSMAERAKEIVLKIDAVYNRKSNGVDIVFEGNTPDFNSLRNAIAAYLPGKDITCAFGTTKIAVTGKRSTGKTSLIEGMEAFQSLHYAVEKTESCLIYKDDCNHAVWYEIKGIDLGQDSIERTNRVVSSLVEEGLTNIVYCVNGRSERMEDAEKTFVRNLVSSYPQVSVMIVITQGITNCHNLVEDIERSIDQIKVVVTLAKEFETGLVDEQTGKDIIKPVHGLSAMSQFIFERR